MKINSSYLGYILMLLFLCSCVDKNLYKGIDEPDEPEVPGVPIVEEYLPYSYPFSHENQDIEAEIIFVTKGNIEYENVKSELPPLKYNKSWLFMLTQDDCKHSAYCRTWAAINGKPISNSTPIIVGTTERQLYYDVEHLRAEDLPPNIYTLEKTLGSTDFCGNEVRFQTTTTLAPEWESMNAKVDIKKSYTDNYYRFYMKSSLRWNNVKEMINFGTAIAFHDVNTQEVNNPDSINKHYQISQNIILNNLSGRGAKMLAEPNGNKNYITAAINFRDIQTMTAQTGTIIIHPYQITNDLSKQLIHRTFVDDPENIKNIIEAQIKLPKEEREAIHVGVHETDNRWIDFLLWLNNTYGKDGDDSVWFPSQEEYYEYNFIRMHSSIKQTVAKDTVKLSIKFPTTSYFYYPSITINMSNLKKEQISSISSNNAITGLSLSNYGNGIMVNIDCRNNLLQHATHYVEIYEKNQNNSNLSDALYFVNQLKTSTSKNELLKRLNSQ